MDKIYLSAKREGDRWLVTDQDGREVAFVKSVTVRAGVDEVTEVSIDFHDASQAEQRPYVSAGK